MKQIISDLVSIPSTADNPQALNQCLDYIEKQLPFWIHEKFESSSKPILIIKNDPGKEFDLILNAHLDVVPPEENFYKVNEDGDKLMGRGVLDMKFAVAVFIKLLQEIKDDTNLKVAAVFTTDEELGGFDGINQVVNRGYNAKVVLMPDGGADMTIEQTEKGVWDVRIKTLGKPAHGSRPYLGDNAIDKLITAYQKLKQQFPNASGESWEVTINAGKISGGTAFNVVCPEAQLDLDIRFPNYDEKKKVEQALEELSQNGVSFETVVEAPPFEIPKDNPNLLKYLEVAEKVTGKKPELIQSAGASDARFFAQKNIPVIISRPEGAGRHTDDEWISQKSLDLYFQVVKEFVNSLKI